MIKFFSHSEFRICKNSLRPLDNVTSSKVVMAEARQLLDFCIRKKFTNKFGESSMHIAHHEGQNSYWSFPAQDCLFPFGVAYALQKYSPYTMRFVQLYLCAHNHSEYLCFVLTNVFTGSGSAEKSSSYRSPALLPFGSSKSRTWSLRGLKEVLSIEDCQKGSERCIYKIPN